MQAAAVESEVSSASPEAWLSQRSTLHSITFNNSTYQCSDWSCGSGGPDDHAQQPPDSSIHHGLEQMGTGGGLEGQARVRPSHNDPDQRHSARRGGVNVPKETGVAHVMLTHTHTQINTHAHDILICLWSHPSRSSYRWKCADPLNTTLLKYLIYTYLNILSLT